MRALLLLGMLIGFLVAPTPARGQAAAAFDARAPRADPQGHRTPMPAPNPVVQRPFAAR